MPEPLPLLDARPCFWMSTVQTGNDHTIEPVQSLVNFPGRFWAKAMAPSIVSGLLSAVWPTSHSMRRPSSSGRPKPRNAASLSVRIAPCGNAQIYSATEMARTEPTDVVPTLPSSIILESACSELPPPE